MPWLDSTRRRKGQNLRGQHASVDLERRRERKFDFDHVAMIAFLIGRRASRESQFLVVCRGEQRRNNCRARTDLEPILQLCLDEVDLVEVANADWAREESRRSSRTRAMQEDSSTDTPRHGIRQSPLSLGEELGCGISEVFKLRFFPHNHLECLVVRDARSSQDRDGESVHVWCGVVQLGDQEVDLPLERLIRRCARRWLSTTTLVYDRASDSTRARLSYKFPEVFRCEQSYMLFIPPTQTSGWDPRR